MNVQPLSDRVVVRRASPDEKTAGGLFIPDTARNKQTAEGTVVAVGPGCWIEAGPKKNTRHPMTVKVGDLVVVSKWGGHTMKVGEEELVFFREDELHGVIEGAQEVEVEVLSTQKQESSSTD